MACVLETILETCITYICLHVVNWHTEYKDNEYAT